MYTKEQLIESLKATSSRNKKMFINKCMKAAVHLADEQFLVAEGAPVNVIVKELRRIAHFFSNNGIITFFRVRRRHYRQTRNKYV